MFEKDLCTRFPNFNIDCGKQDIFFKIRAYVRYEEKRSLFSAIISKSKSFNRMSLKIKPQNFRGDCSMKMEDVNSIVII